MTKIKLFLFAIIFLVVGYIFGFVSCGRLSKKDPGDTFEAGWNTLRKRVESTGNFVQKSDQVITSLSGRIIDISTNKVEIEIISINPLLDPELDNRTVVVDDKTLVYRMSKRDDAEYQKEVESALRDKVNSRPDAPDGMPVRYIQEKISFQELSKGQLVVVKSDQDINNKKQFMASEVIVQGD